MWREIVKVGIGPGLVCATRSVTDVGYRQLSAMRPVYAISRIEANPGRWCWQVLFKRRGERHYKCFYDTKFGGSRKAYAAAVTWRDQQLAASPTLSVREFRQILRSNNESGAPGVIFLKTERMPQGFWQARTRLSTEQVITKSFGVRRYGFEGAFERAVAARAEMLLMIEDRPHIRHPTAKRFAAKQRVSRASPR